MSVLNKKFNEMIPTINEAITFAKNLKRARDNFSGRYPNMHTASQIMSRREEYDNDPDINRTKKEFYDFFNRLSYDDVVLIEAVMYIGRDERNPVEYLEEKQEVLDEGGYWEEDEAGVFDSPQKKLFDHMKHIKTPPNTKAISIDTMYSKAPLAEYLKRGVKVLTAEY
ncbi:hypothetical protein D3P08_03765 [Paenibacillus nanensis]|uniref:Uncharacterized protein n=1 Tax=Paenibacillus nanensis TaxID=393251 RepID=A0A3A1VHV3_9BACL|nr:hypothetical protein [Paenibacillus nanensis]RIX59282.1 hypothetical protein D3P08_03765 [Paenibacillus nanensis]